MTQESFVNAWREENATFHALLREQYPLFDLLQISLSLLKPFPLKSKRYFYQYICFQFHLDMFFIRFTREIETFLFSLFFVLQFRENVIVVKHDWNETLKNYLSNESATDRSLF